MSFYGFAVEKFLCYECQKKENENPERLPDEEYSEEMVYSQKQNEEQLLNYQLK